MYKKHFNKQERKQLAFTYAGLVLGMFLANLII